MLEFLCHSTSLDIPDYNGIGAGASERSPIRGVSEQVLGCGANLLSGFKDNEEFEGKLIPNLDTISRHRGNEPTARRPSTELVILLAGKRGGGVP